MGAKILPMGTRVRFSTQLYRVWDPSIVPANHKNGWGITGKAWHDLKVTPKEGIIVGWRTLADGLVVSNYEAGPEFHKLSTRPAYLVAFNILLKPVFVDPDAIQLVEPEQEQ